MCIQKLVRCPATRLINWLGHFLHAHFLTTSGTSLEHVLSHSCDITDQQMMDYLTRACCAHRQGILTNTSYSDVATTVQCIRQSRTVSGKHFVGYFQTAKLRENTCELVTPLLSPAIYSVLHLV